MKPIRLATLALLLIVASSPELNAQPPHDGWRPESRRDRDHDRRHGHGDDYDHDRGYDHDHDYDHDSARSPRNAVGFFYHELSPYGDWVLTRDHGWAWFPRNMRPDWRPYSEGRWVMTDHGWTWASYEPFGWATYHYGRWSRDWRYGWLWVPDTTWGPAWVSWQSGGGYVGWAPLPPAAGFEAGFGIRFGGGLAVNFGLRPDAYSFVPERSFLDSRLSSQLLPSARNVTIIRNTSDRTRYDSVANRVVNRGVDLRHIEQVTGRRVTQLRIAETRGKGRSEVADREVRIYRPGRQQLDSVHVGPGVNLGLREQAPAAEQDRQQRGAEGRDEKEPAVAPRLDRVPILDTQRSDREDRRKQVELEQFQLEEKRRLDKAHQHEIGKARLAAERSQVERRQQAEREAQAQEQKSSAEQLAARQKAQRQAAAAAVKPGRPIPRDGKKVTVPPPRPPA